VRSFGQATTFVAPILAPLRKNLVEQVFGGADGVRTRDLLDAIEARSQLRYGPTSTAVSTILYHAADKSISPLRVRVLPMAGLVPDVTKSKEHGGVVPGILIANAGIRMMDDIHLESKGAALARE
jgi:hypothetical protein